MNIHTDNICKKENSSVACQCWNLKISQRHIKAKYLHHPRSPSSWIYGSSIGSIYISEKRLARNGAKESFLIYVQWLEKWVFCDGMLMELGWRSLLQWRIDKRLTFFCKCICELVAVERSKDLMLQTLEVHGSRPRSYSDPYETRTYIRWRSFLITIVQ